MKLCICVDGYPSKGLPYSAFIQVLAREMVKQGIEVLVIAPQSLTKHYIRGTKLAPTYFEDIVYINDKKKIIPIYRPYSLTFSSGKLLGRLTFYFNRKVLEKTIKKNKICPDVYYSHFWESAYISRNIAKLQDKPLFVATGEDKIKIMSIISSKEIGKLHDYVSGVICVSNKNLNESAQIGLCPIDKCSVIPNAYNPSEFYVMDRQKCRESLGVKDSDFVVAYCGRFNNRKGAMRVSDAIKSLNDKDIKSIFIGSSVEGDKQQPDCEGILFKGTLPHDRIVTFLNSADVFVLPSLAEGCPNSLIEAMACGLPIISSDLPFNYDILDNDSAILVPPENIGMIASAIKKLKNNSDLRNNLSRASLNKAKELTIEKRVRIILEFIKSRI